MGKRLAIAALLVAALVVLGVLAADRLFDEPGISEPSDAAAPTDASPDAEAPREVRVLAIEGTVERRSGADDWHPLGAGDVLEADDVIRTGPGAVASLDVGGVAEVQVDSGSQISVPALTRTLGQIALEQGRVAARVPGDTRRAFGVTLPDSEAIAKTGRGQFAVLSTGEGEATVAATEGEVEVTAADETVTVGAGEQSQVRAGDVPSTPTPIPSTMFLKVERPTRTVRTRRTKLRGTTTPGAVIRVNGMRVQVSETGAFTAVVPLEEGDNSVSVEGRDVTGRSEESEVDITVDSRGPQVGGDVTWEP